MSLFETRSELDKDTDEIRFVSIQMSNGTLTFDPSAQNVIKNVELAVRMLEQRKIVDCVVLCCICISRVFVLNAFDCQHQQMRKQCCSAWCFWEIYQNYQM